MSYYSEIKLEKDFRSKFITRMIDMSKEYSGKNTLFTHNFSSDRNYLSFINKNYGDYYDRTLKVLLEENILKLEAVSPGSSDLFLEIFFNHFRSKKEYVDIIKDYFEEKVYRISKDDLINFSKDFYERESKEIISHLIDLIEFDDAIFLEDSNRTFSIIKKSNELFFDLDFDDSFIKAVGGKWDRDEYNYIIIDGFIDSLGEIHHLLHKASENKEPYVILCKGMREEVKHTILYNLQRRTIDVMPICLTTNEDNVNILNDVAGCLGSDIVSALKGDVISVEVRRDLNVGKKIKINEKGFYLECQDVKGKERQLKYLKKKMKSINPDDPNYEYIVKRIKILDSKKISVQLGNGIKKQVKTEIDTFLKVIRNSKAGILFVKDNKIGGRSFYSVAELNIIGKTINSLIKVFDSLGCLIYEEY